MTAFATLLTLAIPAAVFRIAARSWLHPAAFAAGFWLLAGTLPLALYPVAGVSWQTIAVITAGVTLFSGAAYLSGRGEPAQKASAVSPGVLRWLSVAGVAAAGLAALVTMRAFGIGVSVLTSWSGIVGAGSRVSVARYADGMHAPPLAAGLLVLTYAACLAAPFGVTHGLRRRWVVAPPLSTLVFAAVTTQRFTLVVAAALTVCGWVAARTVAAGRAPQFTAKGVAWAVLGGLGVAAAFAGIAVVRLGPTGQDVTPILREKLGVYAFGYEPALSSWLASSDAARLPLRWGAASAAPVALLLPADSRDAQRRFQDYAVVSDTGAVSNVYTAFRPLVEDFGMPGAALVIAVFGAVAGRLYRQARGGSPAAGVGLACCLTVVALSAVTSVLTFTNVCAAMVLAAVAVGRPPGRVETSYRKVSATR